MNKTTAWTKEDRVCRRLPLPVALLLSAVMLPSGVFAGPKLGGLDLWLATEEKVVPAGNGASLLRPPASWSWGAPAPTLDFAAGLARSFGAGLSLDAGVSVAHVPELASGAALSADPVQSEINYHDYFLGLRYGSLDGRIWYLPDNGLAGAGEPAGLYYEAGWAQPVGHNLSLSVRMGRYGNVAADSSTVAGGLPSLSLGASTTLSGYGLGLRLIDGGGHMFGGEPDLQLMGSISKPLR